MPDERVPLFVLSGWRFGDWWRLVRGAVLGWLRGQG